MSVLDKVIAAVTPNETGEARRTAREKARASATPGDWLQIALDQHLQIEAAFDSARTAVGDMSAVLADADDARGELELTLQGRIANMTEVDVLGAASELAKRTAALDAAQIVNARLAQMLQPK